MRKPEIAASLRRLSPILILAAVTLVLFLIAPNTLRLGFPAMAMITAAAVFRRSRPLYLQLCVVLWLTTYELRRLVDFRTAYNESAPILLAPYLAAMVSGIVLLRNPRSLSRPGAVPFVCALAGILFGTLFGLTRYPPLDVARALITWLAPVLFGFFLYHEREHYEKLRDAFLPSFLWGTLLTSVYGIIQFFVFPPWDETWMKGLDNQAFGVPAARQLRVFATMNSPAGFATYAMASLLLIFCVLIQTRQSRESSSLRWVAIFGAPAGLLALALTASRSLWVGLLVGALYLAAVLPGKTRVRVVATVFVTLVIGAAATQLPGIHDVVIARLQSFSSGTSDVSASARISGHIDALATLVTEPLGEGMGSTDVDHQTTGKDDSLGPHDSTLLEVLYALGGPGTLMYAIGIGFGLYRIYLSTGAKSPLAIQPFAFAMRAVIFALFGQCLLTSIFIGVPGFLLWVCVAFALSAGELQLRAQSWAQVPDALREPLIEDLTHA